MGRCAGGGYTGAKLIRQPIGLGRQENHASKSTTRACDTSRRCFQAAYGSGPTKKTRKGLMSATLWGVAKRFFPTLRLDGSGPNA